MATAVPKTVGGTSPDYTTIASFESNEQRNLVSADEIAEARMRAATFDESVVFSSGWTTDSTRFIRLTYDPATVTPDGQEGTLPFWNETSNAHCCEMEQNAEFDGIEFKAAAFNSRECIRIGTGSVTVWVKNCIFRDSTNNANDAIYMDNDDGITLHVWNCFFWLIERAGIHSQHINTTWSTGRTINVYHCTFIDVPSKTSDSTYYGGLSSYQNETGTCTWNVKGCLMKQIASGNNRTMEQYGSTGTHAWNIYDTICSDAPLTSLDTGTTSNVTESATFQDTDTPTTGDRVMLQNLTTEDLHLRDTAGNDALEYASDLGDFSTDIEGDTRASGVWDAGGDQVSTAVTGTISGTSSIAVTTAAALDGTGDVDGTSDVAITSTATMSATGAIAGTSSIAITTEGSGQLTLSGSGTSSIVVTTAGSVEATGSVAGASGVAVTTAGTMSATGVAAGTSSIAITTAGDLSGTGAVAGTSSIVFTTAGDLSVVGEGEISGASSVVVTTAGLVKAEGDVAGTTSVVITTAGVLAADGEVAGASSIVVTTAGSIEDGGAPAGPVAGTSSIALTTAGAVSATGAMVGTSAVVVSTSGTAAGSAAVAGTSDVAVTIAGALQGAVLGAGTSSVVFTTSGAVLASAALSATASVVVTCAGQVIATAVLAGSTTIVFTATGTLDQPAATLAGTADIVFSAAGALSNKLDHLKTVTVRRVLDISSGDRIRVRVKRTSGTDVVRTAAQGCDLSAIGPI